VLFGQKDRERTAEAVPDQDRFADILCGEPRPKIRSDGLEQRASGAVATVEAG
jgi:hypothetical protein